MARIRTIKPEFWTSEQIMECSANARLAFIGMWNFCDDGGNHPANAKRLKAEVFPADALSIEFIVTCVDELIRQGLVHPYEADGKAYWHVTGWHHQRIDQPTYKFPRPDGSMPATPGRRRPPASGDKVVREVFAEHPTKTYRTTVDRSSREGKGDGMECMGRDVNTGGKPPSTRSAAAPLPDTQPSTPKPAKNDGASVAAPDWLPAVPWADFIAMRKAMGKQIPFTEAAARGVLTKLKKLQAEGHEPGAVLERSVMNGWRDVFPLPVDGVGGVRGRVPAQGAGISTILNGQSAKQKLMDMERPSAS